MSITTVSPPTPVQQGGSEKFSILAQRGGLALVEF